MSGRTARSPSPAFVVAPAAVYASLPPSALVAMLHAPGPALSSRSRDAIATSLDREVRRLVGGHLRSGPLRRQVAELAYDLVNEAIYDGSSKYHGLVRSDFARAVERRTDAARLQIARLSKRFRIGTGDAGILDDFVGDDGAVLFHIMRACARSIASIQAPRDRRLAVLRLEGHTIEEIAALTGRSKTVVQGFLAGFMPELLDEMRRA